MLLWTMLLFASGEPEVASSAPANALTADLNARIVGEDVQLKATQWSIQSGSFSYDVERAQATFIDNVVVEHEAFVLKATKVTVQAEQEKPRQILAEGTVQIDVMGGLVTSSSVVYLPQKGILRCSGNVKIDSQNQILTGQLIAIELGKEIRCQQDCSVQWK